MEITTKFAWLRRRGVALVLLFGYLMITLVMLEQGRTIAAQQQLIRLLFHDSLELTMVRMQQHGGHR